MYFVLYIQIILIQAAYIFRKFSIFDNTWGDWAE